MEGVYAPGQLRHVARMLAVPPKWLVLGGPSTSDEAQTAVELWPGVRVIGCEPSDRCREEQERRGFPGLLLPYALSDHEGEAEFYPMPGPAGGSMVADWGNSTAPVRVRCTTIDSLEAEYGPFDHCVLWLDIEGSEAAALRGAGGILSSWRVIAVNLEVCDRHPREYSSVRRTLRRAGLAVRDVWNRHQAGYHDELWVRRRYAK